MEIYFSEQQKNKIIELSKKNTIISCIYLTIFLVLIIPTIYLSILSRGLNSRNFIALAIILIIFTLVLLQIVKEIRYKQAIKRNNYRAYSVPIIDKNKQRSKNSNRYTITIEYNGKRYSEFVNYSPPK